MCETKQDANGIIAISRVMSSNLRCLQLASSLVTNCLGGSFQQKNELADVKISGNLITVACSTEASNDFVNNITKHMREKIDNEKD